MIEVFNEAMTKKRCSGRYKKDDDIAIRLPNPKKKMISIIGQIKVEIIKNMKMPTKGETPAQIKRETLWREYWKEKQRMPNNERRRKGLPMVKRPKRQQWISGSKTEKKGRCAKCSRKTRNRKKHL